MNLGPANRVRASLSARPPRNFDRRVDDAIHEVAQSGGLNPNGDADFKFAEPDAHDFANCRSDTGGVATGMPSRRRPTVSR